MTNNITAFELELFAEELAETCQVGRVHWGSARDRPPASDTTCTVYVSTDLNRLSVRIMRASTWTDLGIAVEVADDGSAILASQFLAQRRKEH